MIDSELDGELFTEGYREPGDDGERLAYYILFAIGFCLALACLIAEFFSLFQAHKGLAHSAGMDSFFVILSVVLCSTIGFVFWKECKYWNLRKLTADRVVAGMFLTGIAIFLIGLRLATGIHYSSDDSIRARGIILVLTVGLGAAICLFSLGVGLFFALGEKVRERPRKREGMYIVKRYALDSNLNEHDNYVSPHADGFTAIVVCRTSDGKQIKLVAGSDAYDLADPGKVGTAVTRGSKLQEFHPKR